MNDKSIKFWDKMAARYSKQPISDEDSYQQKLQLSRKYFHEDMDVLEFGCGTGSTAIAHAPFVNQILAIDNSSKMIEIAQHKLDEEKIENISFRCSTLDKSNISKQSLDAVLGLNVLHLMDNWDEVINQVFAILKPGGIFISSTACLANMMLLFRLIAPIGMALGFFPLVKIFTIKELENCLTNAGFIIEHQWQPGKNKATFIVAKKPA